MYFDNASTTMVCGEAAAAALRVMTTNYGNPSSTHTLGREARRELDDARRSVARALGAAENEIFFTSGGTEGDNWAIFGGAETRRRAGQHIITSPTEHDAVLKPVEKLQAKGYEITYLNPDSSGAVRPADVAAALRRDTALISLMMVNNETGAVTDIAAIRGILNREKSQALLHTDAVQGFLKVPFTEKSLGADLITISAHKIHGPKGVGALYIRRGLKLPPLLLGGGQESGLRSGTEGLPQIAAFGEAARAGFEKMRENVAHMEQLRSHVLNRLNAENPGLITVDGGAPHIISISLPGYKSEVLMNYLEARDIFVSKSSACKKGGRSHVLAAIGLKNEVIDGALRLSISRYTTPEECNALCDAVRDARDELFTVLR